MIWIYNESRMKYAYPCAALFVLSLCGFGVEAQTVPELSTTVNELKMMLNTLQTQVSAIHSTLLTQQTMSIEQVCHTIASSLVHDEPKDCSDVQRSGDTKSGVYTIKPAGRGSGVEVFCDLENDGGGWTVIQRRQDGSEDFYRTYAEYENGFGNVTGEYYLGNQNLHDITSSGSYELMVELEDFQQHVKKARYQSFSVGDSSSKYALNVSGYTGTAGDSLMFDHNGHAFSAHDTDNDGAKTVNCAEKHLGGYWYSNCFKSNLNGKWGVPGNQGIIWGSFKDWQMYVLKRTAMKVRPVQSP